MKTYTVHTVIVKGTDNKWHDYNFHGAFEDAAWEEIATLKAAGVSAIALRFDTYKRKATAPHATRFERI